MSSFAKVQELTVAFQKPKQSITALDAVSFTLVPGKTLVLLGESGCGKSLTSLALMRLLPKQAAYGRSSSVYVDNEDILNLPECLMRQLRGRKIAMIFQEPMTALNPVMTIGEQIAEVLVKHHSMTAKACKAALIELLEEVEMPQPQIKMHHYPHQLSGGQKQRVMIAMALACKPEVLIADEPTTALDVTIQAQILALLKKLQQKHQMSLLLITHDLGIVKAMADTVCVMYAGQVVEQSSLDDFFSSFGHPYVQQLVASLPSFAKREEHLAVIKGSVPTLNHMPSGCRFHPRCVYAFDMCRQKEPQLQEIKGKVLRCHLYPDIQQLPPLEKNEVVWKENNAVTETLLLVKDLHIDFKVKNKLFAARTEPFKAVNGLTFCLKQGKTLALVGESGCGKTTVGRAILRLLPVTSGHIDYKGQDVLHMKGHTLKQYRKKTQMIFQDPFSSMNPRMTVREIIAEGMQAQGMKRAFIQKQLVQLIDKVNLPQNSLERYPHQFSGGQRQRICIARALATEPELLICDEPTSALDISVQAQVLNLLKELQQETGISYLFITHNMGVVSYIADEVLVMKEGQMVEFGSCDMVFSDPKQNYTKNLLGSVLMV